MIGSEDRDGICLYTDDPDHWIIEYQKGVVVGKRMFGKPETSIFEVFAEMQELLSELSQL